MNLALPPIKFGPIIKPLPWGGRKLLSLLNKNLPDNTPCGESWELVDLDEEQSIVVDGEYAGITLERLIHRKFQELLGEAALWMGHFPVLFKFIDAKETLSVQVHPDEEASERLGGTARPKTEAWYVLHADEGAHLYLGLARGVDRKRLAAGIESGTVADLLEKVPVQAGDFFYLPAGLLHAIGGGIVLAEIQQSSNTTFRVFDWNRAGLDGKPRELHIREALDSIRYDMRGNQFAAAPFSGRPGIRCKWFSFERVSLGPSGVVPLDAGRPRILSCIEGTGSLVGVSGTPLLILKGETCLIPACRLESLTAEQGGVFLLIRI